MTDITGLLLAAGVGKRFGSHKLLADVHGQPLILRSARCLSPCGRVVAVVRENDEIMHRCLAQAGIEMVINSRAEEGMGCSIAAGVESSSGSGGWCILPADMPSVPATVSRVVVEALRDGAEIAAPFYQHRRGHPVGFGRGFKDELLALKGDSGARTILAAHADQLICLQVEDPGILQDIDTPGDYNRLI